jgi:hypothetical protein
MNEDLQKYLDEDLLDTTPKEKKESTFWMKCVALCLLCSYGIAQFLGRVLGDKQAIVQYGLGRVEAKGWFGEEMGLIGFKAKYKGKGIPFTAVLPGGPLPSGLFQNPYLYVGVKIVLKDETVLAIYVSKEKTMVNTDQYIQDRKIAKKIEEMIKNVCEIS